VPEQRRLSGPGQPLTDSAFEPINSDVLSVRKKTRRSRKSLYLPVRRPGVAALFLCSEVRENRAARVKFLFSCLCFKKILVAGMVRRIIGKPGEKPRF